MELKDIDIPEGVVQQTDPEEMFADAKVDMGNAIYPDINLDVLYENTLIDIEKTIGHIPAFMRSIPRNIFLHNWTSWKTVDEINMERARYLLNTDEILEEMLGKSPE